MNWKLQHQVGKKLFCAINKNFLTKILLSTSLDAISEGPLIPSVAESKKKDRTQLEPCTIELVTNCKLLIDYLFKMWLDIVVKDWFAAIVDIFHWLQKTQ